MKTKELESLHEELTAKENEAANNVAANTNNANKVSNSNSNSSPVKKMKSNDYTRLNEKWANSVPEHLKALVQIILNNSDIRRFTSLGILNTLSQKGEITGTHKYVKFLWNKYAVIVDGIKREYLYNEPVFLNSLAAAIPSLAASTQRIINNYTKKEMNVSIDAAIDKEEVENIVAFNETNSHNKD